MTLLSFFMRPRASRGGYMFLSRKGWKRIAILSFSSAMMAAAAGPGSWYPSPAYAGPPPACPLAAQQDRIIIRFQPDAPHAVRIIANGTGTAEQAALGAATSIPAGTYKVTLSSCDFHFRPDGDTDTQEQWYVILKNASGGDVAQTAAIADIGNQEEWKTGTVNEQLFIGQPVVFGVAFHAAYPAASANEVHPICAAFDPVSSAPDAPTASKVLTLRCASAGGATVTDSVTVNVQSPQQSLPTVDLGANPFFITRGASSILTWSSMDADSCRASGGWSGSRSFSGSETVFPSESTIYAITCVCPGGTVADSKSVTVFPQLQIFAAAVPIASAQTGGTAAATVSKTARNITLNQQDFASTIQVQGNDVIEFRVMVRNTSSQAAAITVRDVFPLDLFYIYQSAKVDGTGVGDSIPTAGGLVISNIGAGQERTVTFRAGVIANAHPLHRSLPAAVRRRSDVWIRARGHAAAVACMAHPAAGRCW